MADTMLVAWVVSDSWIALGFGVPGFLQTDFARQVADVLLAIRPFVQPFLFAAAGLTIFYAWRNFAIVRQYRRRAIKRPVDLVRTAGSVIEDVVGRDELCQVLIENLQSPSRRVHVLQGGVGSGKTAVLVELTRQIARRKAVPINIRLREAQQDLDFTGMALDRFKAEVNSRLLSSSDAERMFRWLRRGDRIVVLADGLEEALVESDGGASKDRDSTIHLAIRSAQDDGLPLVIASRPHDPLRGMDAVVIELEPLGEGPALDYVQKDAEQRERIRLARMTRAVGVTHAPLYLQMIRQLYLEAEPLWRELAGAEDEDKHGMTLGRNQFADKPTLRLRIFETWCEALCKGHLYQDYALKEQHRRDAIECLAALATVAIPDGQQEVRFEALVGAGREPCPADRIARAELSHTLKARLTDVIDDVMTASGAAPAAGFAVNKYQENILRDLAQRPRDGFTPLWNPGDRYDETARDFWLARLRAAAIVGAELGIVEAKQDSVRFRHSLMQAYFGSRYLRAAMEDARYCERALAHPSREFLTALVLGSRYDPPQLPKAISPVECLSTCAHKLAKVQNSAAPDVYAAAFEIDTHIDGSWHRELARCAAHDWSDMQTSDILRRSVVDARVGLVQRMGDAAATVESRPDVPALPLDPRSGPPLAPCTDGAGSDLRPAPGSYFSMFEIAGTEQEHLLRLETAAQIGRGGDAAFEHLARHAPRPWPTAEGAAQTAGHDEVKRCRQRAVRAWLAPLLYLPSHERTSEALANLRRWVDDPAGAHRPGPGSQISLQSEIALAQGFRLAANYRSDASGESADAAERAHKRTVLFDLALEALEGSVFWFSQMALIQALTLLSLPSRPGHRTPHRGHGSDPHGEVRSWLDIASHRDHPFVATAAELATLALTSQRPDNFIWIDEGAVVGQVGSSSRPGTIPSDHAQWILPSTGWTTLHPRAQRLVADVLIMLNLMNRGDDVAREQRLENANRSTLPPCLTGAREQLDVGRTVGSVHGPEIVTVCLPGCKFQLCPYPPKGESSHRSELSEGLCRKLAIDPGRVDWQKGLSRKELRRFWDEMARRTLPRHDGGTDRSTG